MSANATCASGDSYFSDIGEVASWRTDQRADTLAEKGREISDDDKRWDDRTDRMTFVRLSEISDSRAGILLPDISFILLKLLDISRLF